MKTILSIFAATLAFASVNAVASNVNTVNTYRAGQYTCAQIRQIVAAEQTVVLTGFLGGQQVSASREACELSNASGDGQGATSQIMSTSDTDFCFVGYTCFEDGGN